MGSIYERTEESLARLVQSIRDGMDVMRLNDLLDNKYPLGIAAMKGNAQACCLLIAAGADPNKGSAHVSSPISEVLKSLCGENKYPGLGMPDPNVSIADAQEVIKVLVERGASIDGAPLQGSARRMTYNSPIHYAVDGKNHELVSLLAEFGADMDALALVEDAGGIPMEPLGRAQHNKDEDMMITLLRHGAVDKFLGAPMTTGHSPFVGSVIKGYVKVVEYYVRERGEDLAQRVGGRTLLQMAKTPSMRALLRSLKTSLAVDDAINVTTKQPRSSGCQSIMPELAKRPGRSALFPL